MYFAFCPGPGGPLFLLFLLLLCAIFCAPVVAITIALMRWTRRRRSWTAASPSASEDAGSILGL
jgi:uncharacterized iron-regulated membrane protein